MLAIGGRLRTIPRSSTRTSGSTLMILTIRSRRTSRKSVAFWRSPGANAAVMATKSNTFHPSRKKSWGRFPYAVMRIPSSTTKIPRQTSLSTVRRPPTSASMPPYVSSPSTIALNTMTPKMNPWKRRESAILALVLGRAAAIVQVANGANSRRPPACRLAVGGFAPDARRQNHRVRHEISRF
jgi:hypothetical protein